MAGILSESALYFIESSRWRIAYLPVEKICHSLNINFPFCRMKRHIKVLKLPSSVDEHAYMFALDYHAMVQTVRQKQQVISAHDIVFQADVQEKSGCTTVHVS